MTRLPVHRGQPRPGIEGFHHAKSVTIQVPLRWLREYPQMLFPHGIYAAHWHTLVQQREQQRYYHEHRLGMLLQAPRCQFGNNYSYGPAKELTWNDRSGVIRYTPLVDWSPEAMLALIQREQIPLPPCYGWPRGLQVGPGPWPARQGTRSTCHGFDEVWAIDPDIIRSAAPQLPQAARASGGSRKDNIVGQKQGDGGTST
ncbi:MAG TPA: hypothetical protein VJS67_00845 [Pseudonocardiaceae bacterium]|nr:hypothetical protein [Pseudonocardiaceae bacterium]